MVEDTTERLQRLEARVTQLKALWKLPQLDERLQYVQDLSLPHICDAGNNLPRGRVVANYDTIIPEVVTPIQDLRYFAKELGLMGAQYSPKRCEHEPLFKACQGRISREYFDSVVLSRDTPLKISGSFEVRHIYDPRTDITHHFVMPTERFIAEGQSQ